MSRWKDVIRRFFGKDPAADRAQPEAEELRALFRERYRSFLSLLTSNGKALDLMTEMEVALEGARPFGMSFVRSRSTAVSVNVWKMIKCLNELAPGGYDLLFDRHRLIETRINSVLAGGKLFREGPLTLTLARIDNSLVDLVGGKMANLGTIRNELGLNVPNGFVITSAAYGRFMDHDDLRGEIRRRMQARGSDSSGDLQSLSADLQQLIMSWTLPDDLISAIETSYGELELASGSGVNVSVRSSAVGEDVLGRAFAGQFHSELNVSAENLVDAYKQVVASAYGYTAASYRFNRGIPDESVAMCVGVMTMIDSVAGGVIYSGDPFDPRDRNITIYSVWGLPKGVVGGSVPADSFIVGKGGHFEILSRGISTKQEQFVCRTGEGAHRVELDQHRAHAASLNDDQVRSLARIAAHLDETFGAPQDIEWCLGPEGDLHILQCRPLEVTFHGLPQPPKDADGREDAEILSTGETTASRGAGAGPVFVARNEADKLRFPSGAVLVIATASPSWAPLMAKAAAVVAEQGSMAGHLANVAREFRVPALFGVNRATHALREDDLVTVDASCRRIYRGRIEPLLKSPAPSRNLMEGSPVLRTLQTAAAYICPLNLIDPDSVEFRQTKCRTFHDITRFVHEKAVEEMFHFGDKYNYPVRAAKRLKCSVPMQWQVIDLDDGLSEPVEGNLVDIQQIDSVPMLALWRGITSIPWEGPPRVEARGFMSVLVQSTWNTSLDPAVPSPFSAHNYFMISKSFCSFFSRLGYHFSTVEALVTERPHQNYVCFSFKGGAADERRRAVRARMIADILGGNGFRATIEGDRVSARVDHQDEAFMKQCLVILGYLIMHTRQCDMAMGSETAVRHYREKFAADIESLKKT